MYDDDAHFFFAKGVQGLALVLYEYPMPPRYDFWVLYSMSGFDCSWLV